MPFLFLPFVSRRTKFSARTTLYAAGLFLFGLVFLVLTASGAYDGGTRSKTFVLVASSLVTALGLAYLGIMTYNTLYPPEGSAELPGHLRDRQYQQQQQQQQQRYQ